MRSLAIGLVLSLLLLTGASAATPQLAAKQTAAGDVISPEALRFQLEGVYRAVRASLLAADYPTFLRLIIPAHNGKPPPKEAFEKVALNLADDRPVLEQLDFVKVERSGDWAGYYTENRVADPSRTFILFYAFKRTPEGWKMSGRVVVRDIPRGEGQSRTLDEIARNPDFRLPGQTGYREPK